MNFDQSHPMHICMWTGPTKALCGSPSLFHGQSPPILFLSNRQPLSLSHTLPLSTVCCNIGLIIYCKCDFLLIMERLVNTVEMCSKNWNQTDLNSNTIKSEQPVMHRTCKIDNDTNSQMALVNPVGADL